MARDAGANCSPLTMRLCKVPAYIRLGQSQRLELSQLLHELLGVGEAEVNCSIVPANIDFEKGSGWHLELRLKARVNGKESALEGKDFFRLVTVGNCLLMREARVLKAMVTFNALPNEFTGKRNTSLSFFVSLYKDGDLVARTVLVPLYFYDTSHYW